MSIWLTRKEKDGTKSLISAEIPFFLILCLVGLIASIIGPAMFASPEAKFMQLLKISRFFVLTGFSGVVVAKTSMFYKGIWQSWGSNLMSKPFRIIYRTGYVFMFIGLLISLPLWLK